MPEALGGAYFQPESSATTPSVELAIGDLCEPVRRILPGNMPPPRDPVDSIIAKDAQVAEARSIGIDFSSRGFAESLVIHPHVGVKRSKVPHPIARDAANPDAAIFISLYPIIVRGSGVRSSSPVDFPTVPVILLRVPRQLVVGVPTFGVAYLNPIEISITEHDSRPLSVKMTRGHVLAYGINSGGYSIGWRSTLITVKSVSCIVPNAWAVVSVTQTNDRTAINNATITACSIIRPCRLISAP